MFDIIKIILQTLGKSLSVESILKMRKDKKLSEIGTELFLLYSALNTIVVTGRAIIEELESSLNWLERKVDAGEPDREFHTDLDFLLQQQRVNILHFLRSLERLGLELQVISPEAYIKVAPLMAGKLNALGQLASALSSLNLVSSNEDAIRKLIELTAFYADRSDEFPDGNDARIVSIRMLNDHFMLFNSVIVEEGVENLSRIPASKHDVIQSYLERRNPAHALDAIEKIASDIRRGIVENFSLKDILLKVGDRRCAVDDPVTM